MGAWVFFRRARITLFCFLILTCLAWANLFAFLLFRELSYLSRFQKIIVASSLSLYGFTAILLYLMIVTHFRLWWDVARLFVLLVFHTGSSVLFTIYSSRFPCHGFGTETACRKFVYTIFIGGWVLSGIILCFVIALGVMALIPRPVESLQGTEEVDPPFSPTSFGAGSLSPTDAMRNSFFYAIDSRTGFVTYSSGGKSSECTPSPVNIAQGETITMGPPRLRRGLESPNLRHSNNTHGGTISMRKAPTEHTSVISRPRRVDTFHHNPLGNHSPPPASIYSRPSMIRPGVGAKNAFIAKNRLNQSSAFPGLKRDALSPISLHSSPPPVIAPRDLASEYTPTISSVLSHNSVPASPEDHSQRERMYPDRAQTATPSIYSFYSSAASVHPMWEELTPHIPPPPVLTPDTARFRGPNNASFATSGSNAPLRPKLSEPHRATQHYGALWARQPYHPPAKENSRRDSNGQVLDQSQWRRLVLNAAAKP